LIDFSRKWPNKERSRWHRSYSRIKLLEKTNGQIQCFATANKKSQLSYRYQYHQHFQVKSSTGSCYRCQEFIYF